jgi:hypothetical protein
LLVVVQYISWNYHLFSCFSVAAVITLSSLQQLWNNHKQQPFPVKQL